MEKTQFDAAAAAAAPRKQSVFADESRRRQSVADLNANTSGESVLESQPVTCASC
jgi:hypothetical protein